MKYTCSIIINLPIDKTVKLWNDEQYFSEWQDGFESIELLSGKWNQVGAKSKITLKGKRLMELTETIMVANLPHEKKAEYIHIHMTNTQSSRFEFIDDNSTRYVSEVEYTQFNLLILKLIAKIYPSMFKKQSEKWMTQFKEFAEKHSNSILEEKTSDPVFAPTYRKPS